MSLFQGAAVNVSIPLRDLMGFGPVILVVSPTTTYEFQSLSGI